MGELNQRINLADYTLDEIPLSETTIMHIYGSSSNRTPNDALSTLLQIPAHAVLAGMEAWTHDADNIEDLLVTTLGFPPGNVAKGHNSTKAWLLEQFANLQGLPEV